MTIIGFSRRRAAGSGHPSAIARACLIAAACVTLGACAHGGALTQGEVGRSGARTFAAPPEHVFYACLGILKADGYEIATVDPEHGLITTKPMAVDSKDRVTARAYRVTVSADGDGTRVVAQPLLYAGNRDISSDEVWNVDTEREQWAELFSDVDAVIAAPIQVMPDVGRQPAMAAKQPPAAETDRPLAKQPASKTGGGFTPAALDPKNSGSAGTEAGTSRRATTKTENKTAPSSP